MIDDVELHANVLPQLDCARSVREHDLSAEDDEQERDAQRPTFPFDRSDRNRRLRGRRRLDDGHVNLRQRRRRRRCGRRRRGRHLQRSRRRLEDEHRLRRTNARPHSGARSSRTDLGKPRRTRKARRHRCEEIFFRGRRGRRRPLARFDARHARTDGSSHRFLCDARHARVECTRRASVLRRVDVRVVDDSWVSTPPPGELLAVAATAERHGE